MVKTVLGLSLGANVILLLAAMALTKDVPEGGQVCVPIYSATGLECLDRGCVNK